MKGKDFKRFLQGSASKVPEAPASLVQQYSKIQQKMDSQPSSTWASWVQPLMASACVAMVAFVMWKDLRVQSKAITDQQLASFIDKAYDRWDEGLDDEDLNWAD